MSVNLTLYLPSTGTPSATPAFDSEWYDTSSADRVEAVWTNPSGSSFAPKTVTAPALPYPKTANYGVYILCRQYVSPPIITSWLATSAFSLGQIIIDSGGYLQQVTTAGTSGASLPTWNETSGGTTADGTVTWTNKGYNSAYSIYYSTPSFFTVQCSGSITTSDGSAFLATTAASIKLYSSTGTLKSVLRNPFQNSSLAGIGGGCGISGATPGFSYNGPQVPFNSTPTGRTFGESFGSQPSSGNILAAGDYLTVELGYQVVYGNSAGGVSAATASLVFGDSAASLLSYGSTTQNNPWGNFFIGSSSTPPTPPVPSNTTGWLIVNEPSIGLTDRTTYLYQGDGSHSFNLQARQRGNANYTLYIPAGNTYQPTLFQPIYLYDVNAAGATLMFSGIIQSYKNRQIGNGGDIYVDVTAVSLESVFDTVMVTTAVQFVNQTCGAILTTLFNTFESGCPVTLGTIEPGATVPLYVAQIGQKLSAIFSDLATTSQFTWNVNPQTATLFFGTPSTVAAPFAITSSQALWDTISWEEDGSDYRNRQAVKLSYDAFTHSAEFFTGSGQTSFTLLRPVNQVTNAYVTLSTPNSATASFSGLPSAGDTVTVGPASGSWQASHIYGLNGVIVVKGYVQKVTTAGTSGGTQPNFSTVTGQTTTDNSVVWTCQGPLGLGTGQNTYTFVSSLDNTQFGQVLIGSSVANTVLNLVNALNADAGTRGVTYSLPTWENSQGNAISRTSTGFTLQMKAAGTGYVAALSTTSSAFAWSSAYTTGGTSPQGSVGPNEPATISISVYAVGTNTSAPSLSYTQGSAVVNLATPLNSGTNLNVEYTRLDGDVIQVENTSLVTALATTTAGTGKFQQITDVSTEGVIATSSSAGLQLAQESLAAFDVPPLIIEVEILVPGILPGQTLTIGITGPIGTEINGNYYVEEVRAQLVPVWPYLNAPQAPTAGHYRYTVKLIDIAQIGSYLDFWEGLGGGSGGSSSGAALVATSGGNQSTAGSQTGIASPLTTLGDLYVYGPSGPTRLPVGTNGQVLTAKSTATDGVDWETGGTSLDVLHNGIAVVSDANRMNFIDGANVSLNVSTDFTYPTQVDITISADIVGIIADLYHTIDTPNSSENWNWVPASQGTATVDGFFNISAPVDSANTSWRCQYVTLTSSTYTLIAGLCGNILETLAGFGVFVGAPGGSSATTTWLSSHAYTVGAYVIDPSNHAQQCTTAGTSGGSAPTWNDSGGNTTDNTVVWKDMGKQPSMILVINDITNFRVRYQTNYKTTSSTPTSIGNATIPPVFWIKIQDDGTNISIYLSQQNTPWILIYQQSRTAFLTAGATIAGFCVLASTTYTANATLSSWQITYP